MLGLYSLKVIRMDRAKLKQLLSNCPYIYQPIFGLKPDQQPDSVRNGYDRLEVITDVYKKLSSSLGRPLKVLDLGCNAGFYSLALASEGANVIGIETNVGFYELCQFLKKENNVDNMLFMNENFVDLFESNSLEDFDLVLGLSIFHHIASRYSYKKARSILESLSSDGIILLELALFDEVGARGNPEGPSWAKSQPKNYRDWLVNFNWVYEMGRFNTPSSQTSRPVLVASNRFVISETACIDTKSPQSESSQIINIHSNTINISNLNARDI